MNTNLWLIELELPKGVFIVRQSPMTKTEEELEAEIRASDTILQTPPEPSQAIPSTHFKPALLSYHGLHSVAETIATMLSRQFPNPQRQWTPQMFRDLGRVIWEGNLGMPDYSRMRSSRIKFPSWERRGSVLSDRCDHGL